MKNQGKKIGSDPKTFCGLIFSVRFLFRNLLDYSDYSAKKDKHRQSYALDKDKGGVKCRFLEN
ncbi:hypothetical protein I8F73_00115 [Enterococcus faecalis]|nr:hypothetical protein [Enterococcus faecalis]